VQIRARLAESSQINVVFPAARSAGQVIMACSAVKRTGSVARSLPNDTLARGCGYEQ
jgi:hypothetical protein